MTVTAHDVVRGIRAQPRHERSAALDLDLEREPGSGEVALWRAVIQQAFVDALGVEVRDKKQRSRQLVSIRQARLWFADAKRDYREVCAMAGVDADALRERAMRLINIVIAAEQEAEDAGSDLKPQEARALLMRVGGAEIVTRG